MAASGVVKRRMPNALRYLCKLGVDALKPRKENDVWRNPYISKRKAAVIRKQAIIEGTFGSFDSRTGKGWDPIWDVVKQTGTMQLRPPKLTSRQRTREARAQKIQDLLETADEKIDAHYKKEKEERTTERTFENWYKKLSKADKK